MIPFGDGVPVSRTTLPALAVILRNALKRNALKLLNELVELGDSEITALSAGVLVNKLLQISNGALYDQVDGVHFIHDATCL
jgi:hypothetical protein